MLFRVRHFHERLMTFRRGGGGGTDMRCDPGRCRRDAENAGNSDVSREDHRGQGRGHTARERRRSACSDPMAHCARGGVLGFSIACSVGILPVQEPLFRAQIRVSSWTTVMTTPASEAGNTSMRGRTRLGLAAVLGWMLTAVLPAVAASLTGQVTQVIDGDSLIFMPAGAGRALEVRLHGLDAPEACQAGGVAARQFLAAAVLGEPATLQTLGQDVYGRTLGVLTVDRRLINPLLVAEGHAWSARSWPPPAVAGAQRDDRGAGPYAPQERMAKAQRRGVHAKGNAMFPWVFRRQHGPCRRAADAPARRGAAGAAGEAGAAGAGVSRLTATAPSAVPGCRWATAPPAPGRPWPS